MNSSSISKGLVVFSLFSIFFLLSSQLEDNQRWGMNWILSLQKYRTPFRDVIVRILSAFGFELLFILVPFLFNFGWRNVQLIGMNLFVLLNYSLLFGSITKTFFRENRPLYINQSIERVDIIEFSFPSGHTFACTICWIFLCFMFSSLDEKNILSSGDTTETGTPIESHGNRNKYHDTFGTESSHTDKHGLFASESDFLVLRMRKRQYYTLSIMKMVFSPIFGFPIILLTGFSRIYFGLHFPHDIAAGILLGILLFLYREWFLLVDDEYLIYGRPSTSLKNASPDAFRHSIFQWVLLVLLFTLVCTAFEDIHKRQQLGLYFSIGALTSALLLRRFVYIVEDDGDIRRLLMRTFISMLPSLFSISAIRILHKHQSDLIELSVFGFGVFLTSWLLVGSTLVTNRLGLTRRIYPL